MKKILIFATYNTLHLYGIIQRLINVAAPLSNQITLVLQTRDTEVLATLQNYPHIVEVIYTDTDDVKTIGMLAHMITQRH